MRLLQKRTIWIILAILASLAWGREPAAAQPAGPTMHVTVGFDGYCHDSGWCPVYVVLSNEGADIEGELRVTRGTGDSDVYVRRVVLPASSRKGYFLHVPSDNSSRLKVQLYAEDKLLSSQQVEVSWLDEQSRLYGVASGDPSALNFLNDVAPAGGAAAVAHLDLETLPHDTLGWEGLDVLILNDVDTTLLSGEQRQALEMWLAHGGHLIVGGGAGAARTASGIADPSTSSGRGLLPVVVGGTRSMDDLWALGERIGAPVASGPYAVTEAALRDGESLIEQDNLILLARRTCGAGRVDFLAFDAGLNPFVRWDDNARLWESIVGARGAVARGLIVRNGDSARDAINSIPGLRVPSTWHILAFMLVYTLLIGPVNYVILRKLDRRELAWLTIPILIAGFTGCAYLTGFQIRGTQAIVHRLAAVYVPQGAEVGRVSQVVGLFSPRRTHYDVRVADAAVREIPNIYGPMGQSLRVFEEADGMTVSDLRVDVGGIQPFVADGYVDVPPLRSDLRLVSDATGGLQLEGTVHNGNLPLKEAVLIAGGGEQRLGDLDAGTEFAVSLAHTSFSPYSYEDMPGRILGAVDYWNDEVLYRRYEFLQAIFPYGEPNSLAEGVYLVGWVDEDVPLPVEVVGHSFSTVGMAFYVYELPVAAVETEGQITIKPDLITRQMENSTGYVDLWPQGCYVDSGAKVEFSFTVWPGVMVSQVDKLVVDMQTSDDPSHPPAVALWNWESGEWDELDLGWGQHSIPNAGAYVLSPGQVRLRLTAQPDWPASVDDLTITIKGQR